MGCGSVGSYDRVVSSDHFHRYSGSDFFVVEGGQRKTTPLVLVLVVIELSDIVFAVDSVSAI